MLKILDADKTLNLREFKQDGDVFHKALRYVLNGETRFRVINDKGQDYDLLYVNNQEWVESSGKFSKSGLFSKNPLYPPYLVYDEKDVSKICLDIFEGYKGVWFEKISEYSIVLANVILENTELNVYCADERINWFIPNSERLTIKKRFDGKDTLLVYDDFVPSAFTNDFSKMDACVLFHHVFFLQWLTPLKLSDVKYVEVTFLKTEGIGAILMWYRHIKGFFEKYGFSVVLRPDSTRYSDEFLQKYFNLEWTPCEANDNNTIRIVNFLSLVYTKILRFSRISEDPVFSAKLQDEIEEYTKAVLKDRKILGVLLRGSDYLMSHMDGVSRPVPVDSIIPIIRQWYQEGNYDKIFLATEDRDILMAMREAFPGEILAVAQERYSVTDFSDKITTIAELDWINHPGDEYEDFTEDVTINYIYALYLLSRCDSFMYSCICMGVCLVLEWNQNSFCRSFCFATDQVE